jgi:hypothetical protein
MLTLCRQQMTEHVCLNPKQTTRLSCPCATPQPIHHRDTLLSFRPCRWLCQHLLRQPVRLTPSQTDCSACPRLPAPSASHAPPFIAMSTAVACPGPSRYQPAASPGAPPESPLGWLRCRQVEPRSSFRLSALGRAECSLSCESVDRTRREQPAPLKTQRLHSADDLKHEVRAKRRAIRVAAVDMSCVSTDQQ